MLSKFSAVLLSLLIALPPISSAQAPAGETVLAGNVSYTTSRPDGHAPLTVMGEHLHNQGEWMLSYRYMLMRMSGSKIGHSNVSNTRVLADFPVTPTDMTMQMHMLGLMYAPADWITLMAMLPIVRNDMNHRTRAGVQFKTHSEGLGDLKLSGLIHLYEFETENTANKIHLNAGLSVPIGEIDEHAQLPGAGLSQRMPYPMQIGSGTWDLLPGVTYNGQSENWSWGAQGLATIRPGRNTVGYSLGNRYEVTTWAARRWTRWFSQSVGLRYSIWQNIGGRDPGLAPMMVPTADPQSRGGKRLDFLFGVNLYAPSGKLAGHRIALDFGIPVAQSLDGPQLETDWYMTAGYQVAFG